MEKLQTMFTYFVEHFSDIFVEGVIMVSAIIVLIGILKPIVFNKIKYKLLRKVALSFTNVISCFVATFVKFIEAGVKFEWQTYLIASLSLTIFCIISYWFYENTGLRNLIEFIGRKTLCLTAKVGSTAVITDDYIAVKAEAKKSKTELKNYTSNAIKDVVDKDLKGL